MNDFLTSLPTAACWFWYGVTIGRLWLRHRHPGEPSSRVLDVVYYEGKPVVAGLFVLELVYFAYVGQLLDSEGLSCAASFIIWLVNRNAGDDKDDDERRKRRRRKIKEKITRVGSRLVAVPEGASA